MGQAKIKAKNALKKVIEATSPELAAVMEQALKNVRSGSFAERNHLEKMENCLVCGYRHRKNDCPKEYQFTYATRRAHGEFDKDGKQVYTAELLIAGQTPETETVILERKIKAVLGARFFAKKRRHPHSRGKNEIVKQIHPQISVAGVPSSEGNSSEAGAEVPTGIPPVAEATATQVGVSETGIVQETQS